jgi:hypothetical protein
MENEIMAMILDDGDGARRRRPRLALGQPRGAGPWLDGVTMRDGSAGAMDAVMASLD